jgi:putative transcriptional regulator
MGQNGDMPAHAYHRGRLLVAAPAMADPNFSRAVVLLLDHDEDGALGVVLNRPTDVGVADVLPAWGGQASAPDVVFHGGPVGTNSALGVMQVTGTDLPVGFKAMFGGAPTTGLIDLDTPIELLKGAFDGLRIFAGYAGWSPGQLENEIDEGGWIVADSEPGDLTRPASEDLWADVLVRQGGAVALLASYPADPGLN